MRTLICIPTYNERENLPSLVEEILATSAADVLVLDDDSPDGTGQVADLVAQKSPRVEVVHHGPRRGIGRAYLDGFRLGLARGYEALVQMDGDFSHQPRFLGPLLKGLEDADVAVGSRYVAGARISSWSYPRRALSMAGNAYARGVLGMPIRDLTSGFVAYRRHVLEAIDLDAMRSDLYAFQLELKYRAWRAGFTLVEVPIVFFDRVVGSSKLQKSRSAEAILRVLALRLRGTG